LDQNGHLGNQLGNLADAGGGRIGHNGINLWMTA
jgi:hypothetical protein